MNPSENMEVLISAMSCKRYRCFPQQIEYCEFSVLQFDRWHHKASYTLWYYTTVKPESSCEWSIWKTGNLKFYITCFKIESISIVGEY